MVDSYSPWWCQPDTMPGSVRAVPDQVRSVAKASCRSIPGVGGPGLRWSGVTSRTCSRRSAMPASFRRRARPTRQHPACPVARQGPGRCAPGCIHEMLPVEEATVAADVIVVGGGVVGCACAAELAGRGLEVLLLERAELAAGASGRNQGLLLPGLEPHAGPLFREAVEGYRRLAAEGGVDFDLRPVGHLLLAADEATLASAKEQAGTMAAAGFAAEELDAAGLVALEPSLAPDLAGGFRSTDGWALDPAGVTLAWAERARRAGAELRTWTAARRLVVRGGRVTGV